MGVALDVDRLADDLDTRLADADAALAARFPGDRQGRQPVHTVYVPAGAYTARTCPSWGARALAAIDEHPDAFAGLVGDGDVVDRVRDKLAREPIEDLRIDFEDGYGAPGDSVEDVDVAAAAAALAQAQRDGTAGPFHGIRVKSFEAPSRRRGLRTLVGFVEALHGAGGGLGSFVITLPKVTSVDQVRAMVEVCARLEDAAGLAPHTLRFEIQVETPQSVLGPDGTALVARMIHEADGRCSALHYGTYDYSAFCGIAAPFQSLAHPVADHAKLVMQAAAAGTGVRLSDGSTNVLPIGDGPTVLRAWRLHRDLVRRSLERGYYQGWDLHPAQLPTRHAATMTFYRAGFPAAAARLADYLTGTSSAVLDEPATARALADYVLRGMQCGALTSAEVQSATGSSADQVARLARPRR